MQINRLFEIIYILLDKKKVTATELAAHFSVSRQTICRDIDTLSTANIPIYTERGRGGGISLLPEYVLNKSILSAKEQNEILSALHGLSKLQSGTHNETLGKLSTLFHKSTSNWLEVDASDWGFENDDFHHLKTAIIECNTVQFDYYNSYGEKRGRLVCPMQLWFKSKAWYLKAFCTEKEDIRIYKLSRIRNLERTTEHFDHTALPTLVELEHFDTENDMPLRLHIAAEMTYRIHDDFSETEIETQADGSFLVTTNLPKNNWTLGFLLSYGKHLEVLYPKQLQDTLRAEVKAILEKYG